MTAYPSTAKPHNLVVAHVTAKARRALRWDNGTSREQRRLRRAIRNANRKVDGV